MIAAFKPNTLAVLAVLVLLAGILQPFLPVSGEMGDSSATMVMECPSCHVAPDCASHCSLLPDIAFAIVSNPLLQPHDISLPLFLDSVTSILPKPPPRLLA